MISPDVVVVGASNLDISFRMPELPRPGETVNGAEAIRGLGGKGANQSVAAARLGARVRFVSSLGDESVATEIEEQLQAEGIDSGGCTFQPGEQSGRACIWLDQEGENRIVVAPGANALLSEAAVGSGLDPVSTASIVLCQLETPLEGIARAVEWAHEVGARSIVNAAPAAPFRRLPTMPDVLVLNEPEARELLADSEPPTDHLAPALAESFGVDLIAVTLGAAGAVLWREGEQHEIPAPRVAPVDSTGAGDAFCAGFAARLAAGDDPLRAAEIACAAGALTTLGFGSMSTLPTLPEVEALLDAGAPR
jgi:ribokinase